MGLFLRGFSLPQSGRVAGRLSGHKPAILAPFQEKRRNEPGAAMTSSEENDLAFLTTALNHAWAWFEVHAVQRQNFVNFFLIAVAFLSAAYVGALSGNLNGVAAAVCVVGVGISVAFFLLDLRNRELTRAGERPVRELEARLADAVGVASLRILEGIDRPRHAWISQGKIIRAIHSAAMICFIVAGCYALLSR